MTSPVFARSMRALAVAVDLEDELAGLPVPQAFAKLYELSDKQDVLARIAGYAQGQLHGLKIQLGMPGMDFKAMDLKPEVESFLFHSLAAAMAHRYTSNVPQVHHWVPYSYTVRFAHHKTKRACDVHALDFARSPEGLIGARSDRDFAHGKDEAGNGFYHLAVEQFFSRIEATSGSYFHGLAAPNSVPTAHGLVAHMAFFLAQAVRNPHPKSHSFARRDIEGIVEGLMAECGRLDRVFLTVRHSPARLAFTPYVPTRVHRSADGTETLYLPLSPSWALLASSRPLATGEGHRIVAGARLAVVKHARRTGGIVFGVTHKQAR